MSSDQLIMFIISSGREYRQSNGHYDGSEALGNNTGGERHWLLRRQAHEIRHYSLEEIIFIKIFIQHYERDLCDLRIIILRICF